MVSLIIQETEPKEGDTVINLPSYNVATSLPSYEEAEQTKQEQAERQQQEQSRSATTQVSNHVHI